MPVPAMERHYRWKGGRVLRKNGYVMCKAEGHSRQDKDGYVAEHVLVAEGALGHALSPFHPVHHFDEIRSNNSPGNLVICQDKEYHHLLHARARIQKAGGNPNTQKICSTCKRLVLRIKFVLARNQYDGLSLQCRECTARRSREYYEKNRHAVLLLQRTRYAEKHSRWADSASAHSTGRR